MFGILRDTWLEVMVPSVALRRGERVDDGISRRIKIHKAQRRRENDREGAGKFKAGVEATWTREDGGITQ